jgi:hypothetical protein
MLTSASAIVARNEEWSGESATEPYEAGWATEALFFVRALKPSLGDPGVAWVEISPDGMNWVRDGEEFVLPTNSQGVALARASHFGTWLRLAARMPQGSALTVLVTLHLKG